MSSDDGNHNGEQPTWYDKWQEDHGDEDYEYTNPRYEELGAGDNTGEIYWPHRDPDRQYGGIAWGEYEIYADHKQAEEARDYLYENMNDLTGNGAKEVGYIHMYLNDSYEWQVDYIVFVEGGTGDS